MPRRALIVGINSYDNVESLSACVADAKAMHEALSRHKDGRLNYECRVLLDKTEQNGRIAKAALRAACRELFTAFSGEILLYFSGHGVLTEFGGWLCTTEAEEEDWGISMQEIVKMATDSPASHILLLLDCCHSGAFANQSFAKGGANPLAVLRENMTVIAASQVGVLSVEAGGHGLFTAALLDALDGGAADHMGWITAPSIYSYVERRFGAWEQRPVYKTNATGVLVVRECEPLIDRLKLHRITELFSTIDHRYQLDPEFEPEDEHGNVHEPRNPVKLEIARLFKDYRDAGLLKACILGEQLYWTARRSHSVELTARGKEYWWLVKYQKV
jgi:hypothetical protein